MGSRDLWTHSSEFLDPPLHLLSTDLARPLSPRTHSPLSGHSGVRSGVEWSEPGPSKRDRGVTSFYSIKRRHWLRSDKKRDITTETQSIAISMYKNLEFGQSPGWFIIWQISSTFNRDHAARNTHTHGLFMPAYTHTRVRTLHEWNMGGGTLRRLGWAPPAISCESTTFMAGVISLCFFLVLFIFLLLSAVSSPLVGLYPLCGTFSPFVGDSYRFHLCAGSSLSYFS